jgi:hypothetical protein
MAVVELKLTKGIMLSTREYRGVKVFEYISTKWPTSEAMSSSAFFRVGRVAKARLMGIQKID